MFAQNFSTSDTGAVIEDWSLLAAGPVGPGLALVTQVSGGVPPHGKEITGLPGDGITGFRRCGQNRLTNGRFEDDEDKIDNVVVGI